MTKVIATDLDGTLFYPKSRVRMIPKRNKRFLTRFINDGGKVVVVTSRHKSFTDKIAAKLGHQIDVIGADGACIIHDGKIIHESFFDPELTRKLVYDLRDNYDPKLVMLASKRYPLIKMRSQTSALANFMYSIYMLFEGVYREPSRLSDQIFFQEISKGEANKLMVLIGLSKKKQKLAKKITEKLQSDYPDFEFVWLNQFIEITPKGCNKAHGLSIYLDNLGINDDNVTVVGDSGNDVPMFRLFQTHSYAMAHSPESVRKEASGVIRYVSDLEQKLYPLEDSK